MICCKPDKKLFFLSVIYVTVAVSSLVLGISTFNKYQTKINKASVTVPRGTSGDLWADSVLGQIDFGQMNINEVVDKKVSNPGGVVVDRTRSPNVVYVYDGGNSRILVHKSLGVCENNSSVKCTSNSDCSASKCKLTQNKAADLVIGQPQANRYNACNGDSNMQQYPDRSTASSSTLCSMPEVINSPLEAGSFSSMAVDASGNLYVTDFQNSRVLKYISPTATDTVADEVWGQDNFGGNRCNKAFNEVTDASIPNPTSSSLCMGLNSSSQESFTAGVEIDKNGNLWVADSSNHRVLRFPKNTSTGVVAKVADLVLGQPNFTSRQSGNSLQANSSQMNQPSSVRLDSFPITYGQMFTDVPSSFWAVKWIEALASEGVTGGCGTNKYCPSTAVTRDQMAIFLLRTKYGSSYTPPAATGTMFDDVPKTFWAASWIEALANEGVTGGCGTKKYCPSTAVTRDQMAIFLLRTKYGSSYSPPASKDVLYVSDYANGRVLSYKSPFVSGMQATTFGSGFFMPVNIEIDPSGAGIWVSDSGAASNHMIELWDKTGTSVKKVLLKDVYRTNEVCGAGKSVTCINKQTDGSCLYIMCDSRGSIGFDKDGNIFVSSSQGQQDVYRFPAPIANPVDGVVNAADYRMFYPPDGSNFQSGKSLFSPRSIVVKNNQLIVSDGHRILFWNNPLSVTNGKAADGYVAAANFNDSNIHTIHGISADGLNRLWVVRESSVDVYQLPLVSGATAIKTDVIAASKGLNVLGGGTFSWNWGDPFWGISVDTSGNYLWLAQADQSRVIRVRNPYDNPQVDVVLGQTTLNGTSCNMGGQVANNSLCYPGLVNIDREGNVWVSDNSLEARGNGRFMMFSKSLFENLNQLLYAPNATIISPHVLPWNVAFNSKNNMVAGYNKYMLYPDSLVNNAQFPGLYVNPKSTLGTTAVPEYRIKDYFSQAYGVAFDENDNLYISDLNRSRILIYKSIAY